MTAHILLVAHIVVLGYWLGADLVINSEYRFICFRDELDFAARDAMTGHLMDVDQHVRYALILQLVLGAMLMAEIGLAPSATSWIAPVGGAGWVALIEFVHRSRESEAGKALAQVDRILRYAVAAGLLAAGLLGSLPFWLAAKLVAFAGIIGCGVAIRFALIRHFITWVQMRHQGPTAEGNAVIKRIYWQATSILGLLWVLIVTIAALAIFKPI